MAMNKGVNDTKIVTSDGDAYVDADVFDRMVARGDVIEVQDFDGRTFYWSVSTEAVRQAVREVQREMESPS